MALRVLIAAVLSAIVMFLWGFVFWGPVLNMTARLMAPLPADVELDLLAPLRAAQVPDGMYLYPGPMTGADDEEARAAWEKKLADGPVIHMAYHQYGFSPMDPAMFVKGLEHNFVIALISGLLLALVLNSTPTYGLRVLVLTLLSFVAAVWTNFGNVIWWFHTPRYGIGQFVYTFVAGVLMALVTAAIVRIRSDRTRRNAGI